MASYLLFPITLKCHALIDTLPFQPNREGVVSVVDHRRAADKISELVVQPGQGKRPQMPLEGRAPGAGNRGTMFSQSYSEGGTQPDGCLVVDSSIG